MMELCSLIKIFYHLKACAMCAVTNKIRVAASNIYNESIFSVLWVCFKTLRNLIIKSPQNLIIKSPLFPAILLLIFQKLVDTFHFLCC
uniref:Uncharacterized protein n=1 Tax=Pyxicephalus adspersus TaxID=30357 RepID=A0AAV3A3X4_PYXAD|nr:TPA: hypothetical protein GDO54_017965 [Pyxicephalus adspersus]